MAGCYVQNGDVSSLHGKEDLEILLDNSIPNKKERKLAVFNKLISACTQLQVSINIQSVK